ncbi:MAG: GGDEF domain-containing protein [Deltaproteobacteria bacterium]|nr:GGDEF domain-containing protein [Deltaproteobacteria bacterium]
MEAKDELSLDNTDALKLKFLAAERRLQIMELERIDFVQAMRLVLRATSTILRQRGFNNDLVNHLKQLEVQLGTDTGYLELVEQAVQAIAKLNSGGKTVTTWNLEGPALTEHEELNLKEVIRGLADKLEKFKHNRYQRSGQVLRHLMDIGASLENFLPVLVDICSRFLRDYGNELGKISFRLTSIIRTLIFTEKEYTKFLDRSINYFDKENRSFCQGLTSDLTDIRSTVTDVNGSDPDSLIMVINEKLDNIFAAISKKNQDDEIRLGELDVEKKRLENSLESVRRDYNSFVCQSHSALHELEAIKMISLRDSLTQVYNRRAYDEQIALTLNNFAKGGLLTFGLIIFDIDNFRDVNNNFGHLAGDGILCHVARLVREALRSDDFIFRYGGDEFIVILPEANLRDTVKVADKLRRQIEVVEFQVNQNSDTTIPVTISLGVSEVVKGDTPTSILARADQALYKSKQSGRNMVSVVA